MIHGFSRHQTRLAACLSAVPIRVCSPCSHTLPTVVDCPNMLGRRKNRMFVYIAPLLLSKRKGFFSLIGVSSENGVE
jgi:hypothetical protein